MKLFEVLDTRVDFKTIRESEDGARYTFVIDEQKYEVDFARYDGSHHTYAMPEDTDGMYDVAFTSGQFAFGVTGGGNAFKVFGVVVSIIQHYMDKFNAKGVIFSADEDSRIKLYNRMTKILSSKYGYHVQKVDSRVWAVTKQPTNESKDYTKQQVPKHSELKLLNMLDKKDWGKKTGSKTSDALVRDSKTKTIYGRRQIVQRDI